MYHLFHIITNYYDHFGPKDESTIHTTALTVKNFINYFNKIAVKDLFYTLYIGH